MVVFAIILSTFLALGFLIFLEARWRSPIVVMMPSGDIVIRRLTVLGPQFIGPDYFWWSLNNWQQAKIFRSKEEAELWLKNYKSFNSEIGKPL